jgi:peptide chain release factor
MKHKIVLQITSGRGPHECTWVVAQVLRELQREANLCGIETIICSQVNGLLPDTIASVLIELKGEINNQFLNSWLGTIQWIGQSPFRKLHKRKNWFIGVIKADIPLVIKMRNSDITYQVMRSSGAGGQNVNKVNSCVRAIHVPTGLSATAMDTRSQHQNKQLARERLNGKFDQNSYAQMHKSIDDLWLNQFQIERGNSMRTYEGSKFKQRQNSV